MPHLPSPPPHLSFEMRSWEGNPQTSSPPCREGSESHRTRTRTSLGQEQGGPLALTAGMNLDETSRPNVGSWQIRSCPSPAALTRGCALCTPSHAWHVTPTAVACDRGGFFPFPISPGFTLCPSPSVQSTGNSSTQLTENLPSCVSHPPVLCSR